MSVYCRLKIAVLFAALAANAGDGRQLLFGQIGASFDHPRLAKVFAGFRVVRFQRQRPLIIANSFIGSAELTGGVAAIVPRLRRIGVVQRIQQVKCGLIFAFFARCQA